MRSERIVRFERSRAKHKKYAAIVEDRTTGKRRRLNFGDTRYGHYRDITPLKLYSHLDSNSRAQRRRYYMRHSGVPTKRQALQRFGPDAPYTPKLLAHLYLW